MDASTLRLDLTWTVAENAARDETQLAIPVGDRPDPLRRVAVVEGSQVVLVTALGQDRVHILERALERCRGRAAALGSGGRRSIH
jgi:hypothetical protein